MPLLSDPPTADLAALVAEHQATVWRYLRFLGASPADAEDLTQETFLAVARATFDQRSPAETAAYLRTVARHQLLMSRRKQSRQVSTVELDAADAVWNATVGSGGMDAYLDALGDCVEQLDGRARQAIDQFYAERRGRDEIAQNLQMKPEGVKTLLRRTRDILKQCVERRLKNETEK